MEQNKALVRRYIEEVFNQGNLSVIDELFPPNYTLHDPATPTLPAGQQGVRQQVSMYRQAFPDVKITIDDMYTDGDTVITRWTARGTHKGEIFGLSPTSKSAKVSGITIDKLSGGKFQESWVEWNLVSLLQQLGIKEMPRLEAASRS